MLYLFIGAKMRSEALADVRPYPAVSFWFYKLYSINRICLFSDNNRRMMFITIAIYFYWHSLPERSTEKCFSFLCLISFFGFLALIFLLFFFIFFFLFPFFSYFFSFFLRINHDWISFCVTHGDQTRIRFKAPTLSKWISHLTRPVSTETFTIWWPSWVTVSVEMSAQDIELYRSSS